MRSICTGEEYTVGDTIILCRKGTLNPDRKTVKCSLKRYGGNPELFRCERCPKRRPGETIYLKDPYNENPGDVNLPELSQKNCIEVEGLYNIMCEEILTSDNIFMKEHLAAHIKVIENRHGFTACQKTSRRKLIIRLWDNAKKRDAEKKNLI